MTKYIFWSIVFFNIIGFAKAPIAGKFDWTQLTGRYKYVSCELIKNKPIWADAPETTQIEIYIDYTSDASTLNLIRWPEEDTLILLGASLEKINKGRQIVYDEETNKVWKNSISYSTVDGVFSHSKWNVKDINIGWHKIQLQMLEGGLVTYKMQLSQDKADLVSEEICTLKLFKRN